MRIAILELAINRSPGCDIDHWRAVMRSKDSSPVLRGAVGKGLIFQYLAGHLLYLTHGSEVAVGEEIPPPTITAQRAKAKFACGELRRSKALGACWQELSLEGIEE